MAFDLVIFDCDGVLVDSEPIVNRAHAETLTACGCAFDGAELLERFCGMSDKDMLATIERERGWMRPSDYETRVAAIVARDYATSLQAIDGVAAVLAALTVPCCVASSGVPAQIRRGLGATGLAGYFGDRLFSATMVARGKPAPDLFLYAAARMQARPAHCVVIEDSLPGVAGAVSAGMTAIGFVGGGHCRSDHAQRLAAHGAAAVIDRMSQLLPALDKLLR
ncbi:MAG TPA: HAD family hydrolase [Stellaceae bacterium]|jgi:HAD superfamily hydrolase (TIGR01509 family)|nr:HAD family hydrolase [Stellaceae bacterium]